MSHGHGKGVPRARVQGFARTGCGAAEARRVKDAVQKIIRGGSKKAKPSAQQGDLEIRPNKKCFTEAAEITKEL
jgi:hypothetical protein